MEQKIRDHGSFLVVLSVILTFFAACFVMYGKFETNMKQSVRNELDYVRAGLEEIGEDYLNGNIGELSESRITLIDPEGNVLFDSHADHKELENHKTRPEFIEASGEGYGEASRFSETLSKQTFYSAVKLKNGNLLRMARTIDSVFFTLMSSFTLLGVILLAILGLEFFLVQRQTKSLIEPINNLDLEHPLENVCYQELSPLLKRVDQQNRQIALQVEELKKAEAMRREFSANVSHELKTPLMSISGYAELMMNGMAGPEHVQEFSARIYHEASRLGTLVQDIIQLSRLEGMERDMPFETVDVFELAEDIVQQLRNAAEKKHIALIFDGEPAAVRGVRQVLYEMFYNLADNAVKYTPEGGRVEIYAGKSGSRPCFRVTDNGIGIPENQQERVFERFYRVDKSHSRKTGGTGLGLSIVKHGAALHGARINMESAPGKGTKMELLF